jgi:hypothetical protein
MNKKLLLISFSVFFLMTSTHAQGLKGLLNKAKEVVNTSKTGTLGNDEIIAGLKEALANGTQKGTAFLSKENGFFGNEAIKILLPPEAVKVENTLRKVGLGKQVDDAILTINRGAEEATKQATPIFVNAIKQMTVTDALGILRGADTAATGFLRKSTTNSLSVAFRPVIEASLEKTGATKNWTTIINAYNKFSLQKINPDLTGYVTDKALTALFTQIAMEEKNIRKDPIARTSDLLKKVFSN